MTRTNRTEAEQVELLRHIQKTYKYDAESGVVINRRSNWIKTPVPSACSSYKKYNIKWKGKTINIDCHRLVWVLCKGRWPEGTIDHIDGNRVNNHIENLRVCSMSDNRLNMELPWKPNPKTGLPGVCEHGNKYRNRIRGHKITFDNAYEAFFYATLCGKRYRCA